MKLKIFYIFSVFLIFIFFFLFGEILTRFLITGIIKYPENAKVIDPYAPNPYIISFQQRFHSHYPNVEYTQSRANYSVKYKINSRGFRESEFASEPEKKRLIFVGDSVVEGHGVEYENTFVNLVKNKLKEKNIEVLNLGIQGAAFSFHALNLDRFFTYKPNAIVFCITENDWVDDRVLELSKNKLPVLENPYLFEESNFRYLFHSKLIQFFYFQYYSFHRPKSKLEKLILSNVKAFEKLMDNQVDLDLYTEHRTMDSKKASGNFAISKVYFQYIIEECKKRNIQIFFVNLSYMAYTLKPYRHGNKDFAIASNELAKTYFSENKIQYLDLKDIVQNFYRKNPKDEFYIINDDHPTKEAHALFGERIASWLLTFNL